MPFSANGSVTSTDMNNMLRGLYRDNSDHAVTGTTNETDMASTSISANSIGATGMLHIIASGTITGSAGNKQIKVSFGGTVISDTGSLSGTGDWFIDLWLINTASNAQRIHFLRGEISATTTQNHDYTTASVDTTGTQTLKLTGTLANSADTITQKTFNVFVCQIT